jgi:hypothetical protein
VNAYVQWFPMTKIQLEYFLSSTNDAMFDEAWYYQINSFNSRISPNQVRSGNYWQTLATGLLPREALRVAIWYGRGYDLPTVAEWQHIYAAADQVFADKAHVHQIASLPDIKERPRRLIERIDGILPADGGALGGRTLADQMMLRQGVMEFVYEGDERNTFAGLGQTNGSFVGSLMPPDEAQRLTNPTEGTRMKHYGFRLIRRGRIEDR